MEQSTYAARLKEPASGDISVPGLWMTWGRKLQNMGVA